MCGWGGCSSRGVIRSAKELQAPPAGPLHPPLGLPRETWFLQPLNLALLSMAAAAGSWVMPLKNKALRKIPLRSAAPRPPPPATCFPFCFLHTQSLRASSTGHLLTLCEPQATAGPPGLSRSHPCPSHGFYNLGDLWFLCNLLLADNYYGYSENQ